MLTRAHLRPALVFALGLTLVACDTTDMTQSSATPAASLSTQAESTGDVLYDLAPLAIGETFSIAADVTGGTIQLQSTRTPNGYALSFDAGTLAPKSVEIRYLADGREVAPRRTVAAGEPVLAGYGEGGPDSWHYDCEGNVCGWMKDYKQNLTGAGGGTRFRTPDGEVLWVTHVAFYPAGLDAAPPTQVRFESPSDFRLTSASFQ